MGIPRDIVQREPGLSLWCILSAYRGSISHNMFVPKNDPNSIDDRDVMAVCVPDHHHYLGLESYGHQNNGTKEIKEGEWDIVVYELRKFMALLLKGNPNVLSLLWTDENHFLVRTTAGNMLLDNRKLFVGKHVYQSFVGYAHGQLHRMTHMAFEGYMGEKRKGLVEKFGYDTKNATHLIRLLRMGSEFLLTGELLVARPDNNQLLEIKRGEWSLERVQAEADRQFARAEEAFTKSTLPVEPDKRAVSELCVDIISETWRSRRARKIG